MSAPSGLRWLALAVASVAAAGCTRAHPPAVHPPAAAPPSTAAPITATPHGTCPVTIPAPVPASEPWRTALFGSDSAYGNGQLWVGGLGAGGVFDAGPDFIGPDGTASMKLGWWRAVTGQLMITGRRLDGTAPPLRSSVPDGYGESGFQSSGVYFPTPGCWEITGRAGPTGITFVVLVRLTSDTQVSAVPSPP